MPIQQATDVRSTDCAIYWASLFGTPVSLYSRPLDCQDGLIVCWLTQVIIQSCLLHLQFNWLACCSIVWINKSCANTCCALLVYYWFFIFDVYSFGLSICQWFASLNSWYILLNCNDQIFYLIYSSMVMGKFTQPSVHLRIS